MDRICSTGIWKCLLAALAVGVTASVAGADGSAPPAPLTADECVRLALLNSPTLAQAAAHRTSAHGSYLASLSGLLPSVGGTASWSRTYENYLGETRYSGSMGIGWQQTLLDIPAVESIRSSGRQLRAATSDVAATRDELEIGVRQQFYSCVGASRLAEVEARAAQLARDQLHRSETLFQLGSVARSDVLQAQVNVAAAEQTATQARNDVPVELGRLAVVMGLDPLQPIAADTSVVVPETDPQGPLDGFVRQALTARPDVAAARARLEASRISELGARTQRLPSISGSAGWSRVADRQGNAALNDPLGSYANSVSLRVQASLPIFSGLQIEGGIESAKGSRRAQELAVAALDQQVAQEVQEAYLGIANQREQLRSARTSVSLAEENLRLQQALYESGAGTLLEWDNARLALRRARVTQIQAELSLLLAHATFRKAIGG
jgi:outer membrane protein